MRALRNPSRPAGFTLALLLLAAGPTPRVGAESAALTGKMFAGGANREGTIWVQRSLEDKMDGLGFERESGIHEVTLPWEGGPKLRIPEDLEEGFETLHYDELLEAYFRPEPDEKRQPGHDFQRNISGVTGILTLPNSYVLAPGVWAAGLWAQFEDVGPAHWTEVYVRQENTHLKGTLSRGFHNNVEAGLILHYQDADITYANQGANPNNVRFDDSFVLGGVNVKAAIPFYGLWMSVGYIQEFFDDDDRSFQDLRIYDNISTAFLTFSDSGPRWDASIAMKFIQYASDSRRPPVGGGGFQLGYSPTTKWNQVGVGIEYGKWGGFSTLLEWTQRHSIEFIGTAETEMNYGFKYEKNNMVLKAFTLRQNTDDSDVYGASASLRF